VKSFLQRFASVVAGVLCGFDRAVFKGRLPQLYSPDGMNCYEVERIVVRRSQRNPKLNRGEQNQQVSRQARQFGSSAQVFCILDFIVCFVSLW